MVDKQLDRKGARVANALKAPVAVGFCGSLGHICSRSLVVRRNKKMKELMEPIRTLVDFKRGVVNPDGVIERKTSDMQGMYADELALKKLLSQANPLIYQIREVNIPEETGHIIYSTTIIYPGKVGDEYFMTKGHFHAKEGTAEIYFCLEGEGYLLMQTRQGRVSAIHMKPGVLGYIPPYWGHRTINTGNEEFVFLTLFPGDAGHNYEIIEKCGFAKMMVEEDGRAVLKDNPKYTPLNG